MKNGSIKWMRLLLPMLLLAGCSQPSAPDAQPEESADSLRFLLETEEQNQTETADDGTELLNARFEIPVLYVIRENGETVQEAQNDQETAALETAAAFNDQFTQWLASSEMQETATFAKEDFEGRQAEGIPWETPYTMDFAYSAYQTEHLISINGTYDSYTGGAHSNTAQMAWNFDLESGTFFTPMVLAVDNEEFSQTVTQALIAQAQQKAEEDGLAPDGLFWADYADILADWSSYAVSFDETGMTVSFSPYELAAYAAGPQIFHLTYDQIAPYLSTHGAEVLGLNQPAS